MKIAFELEPNEDKEITCMVCCLRCCDYSILTKGYGRTSWHGVHLKCVEKYLLVGGTSLTPKPTPAPSQILDMADVQREAQTRTFEVTLPPLSGRTPRV